MSEGAVLTVVAVALAVVIAGVIVLLDWLGRRGENEARLRLSASLGRFWYVRGYLSEGLECLADAVERAPGADPALLANALRTAVPSPASACTTPE